MRTFNIMSIDPGGTTGWVLLALNASPGQYQYKPAHQVVKDAKEDGRLRFGDITGTHPHQAVKLYKMMIQSNVRVAIIEQFRIDPVKVRTTKAKDLLSPVRVGSGVEALIEYGSPGLPKTLIVKQFPSDMGVITDDRLRTWGLWVPGKKDVRAAMKHLLVYLRKGAVS